MAVAAPGSPLTSPPTPCAPHHTTPPLAAAAGGCGGGSVGVVACVATWSTHWLCWCCPRPCHSHTHTHGVVGTWWWWLCVCGVAATTTVPHSHQPPPLCPLPRPVRCVCVCVCVVAPGTAAHCGGTHAGVCVCGCVCAVPTTPTTHAVHPCRLSLLALPIPHLPLTHTWHASRHTHTWRALCASSHPLTHTLAASLPTRPTHTHATGCACAHPPALIRHHTHTRDAQAWRMHGWLGVWSPPPRPLCPPLTHSHSGTGGGRHGGAWWCGCGLCVPPTPPTTTPSLPPPPPTLLCHHRPHTHTGLGGCTTATHTRHMHHHTHQRVLCGAHTMPLTHTPPATHTHNGACHRSPRRPHSHTQRMPHTHTTQVRDQGHAHQWVWPLVSHHHHAGLGLSLCCVGGFLSTNPFSLSLIHPLPPPHPPTTTIPSIPCVVCGVVWERTAPGTTVVVKHATHTPVEHCVHGSHHPTLHPPLTPLLVLFPPPTTTPSLFSTHHHHHHTHTPQGHCGHPLPTLLPHTHMVWVACGFVAALSCCVSE